MIAFIILLNCILNHEDIATCNFYFSVTDYNICTLPLQTISCQVRLCTTTSVNSLITVVQFTRKFFLTTEHWVQIYPSQKNINYISPSSIRSSQCWKQPFLATQFAPILSPFPHLTFYRPPPSLARFCDTRISSLLYFSDKLGAVVTFHQI